MRRVAEQTPALMTREDSTLVCVCVCFDADYQRHIYCRIVHALQDAKRSEDFGFTARSVKRHLVFKSPKVFDLDYTDLSKVCDENSVFTFLCWRGDG